ncbi:hypothetical protein MUO32_11270 [Shinella sp. CPCC 101442]|uniref:hypothetical protein n=1 Tax=Shinella sp. CPCC 101442 TaxID=2932265 RepID=UPI002152AA88|nr:hypothetical protein [Shinella sp. CPCC 101442]MCR6499616.1 hypothetical protein [Shinella sp. CPCC 101442]
MDGTKIRKTGLFFWEGRFFDVWTGEEAGDKSLQFSCAPEVFGLFARWAAGVCKFDGIRGWRVFLGLRAGTPAGGAVSHLLNMKIWWMLRLA